MWQKRGEVDCASNVLNWSKALSKCFILQYYLQQRRFYSTVKMTKTTKNNCQCCTFHVLLPTLAWPVGLVESGSGCYTGSHGIDSHPGRKFVWWARSFHSVSRSNLSIICMSISCLAVIMKALPCLKLDGVVLKLWTIIIITWLHGEQLLSPCQWLPPLYLLHLRHFWHYYRLMHRHDYLRKC